VKKRIFLGAVLGLSVLVLIFRDLIAYGFLQGKGQLTILWQARPLEEFLSDDHFPDSLKQKLVLIQEVKQYAFDSLGINPSRNYSTMYDQKGEYLLWNVTAAERFAMIPYQWTFPFLGSFPYKGFFEMEKAREEKAKLDSLGYDTHIGPVSGWSTLGWFRDPILSKMLERSEGDLADLIIHELTHGTLYVKDSVEFNENLASFVGRMGAIRFLAFKYGRESKEYFEFTNSEGDYEKIYNHYLIGARKLDSLYQSMEDTMPNAKKEELKAKMILNIMNALDTLNFVARKPIKWNAEGKLPNNTFFMSYLRYRGKLTTFDKELNDRFGGDLRAYVTYLKETYPSL